MSNRCIITIGIVCIACIFLFSNTVAAAAIFDETNIIESGESLVFSLTEIDNSNAKYVQADIQVINGGTIDILVVDEETYIKYKNRFAIEEFATHTVKQVKGKVYRFNVPDGEYYIIVDNTKGTNSVDVRTKLIMSGDLVEEPGFEAIYTVVMLCLLSILIRRGKE